MNLQEKKILRLPARFELFDVIMELCKTFFSIFRKNRTGTRLPMLPLVMQPLAWHELELLPSLGNSEQWERDGVPVFLVERSKINKQQRFLNFLMKI